MFGEAADAAEAADASQPPVMEYMAPEGAGDSHPQVNFVFPWQ